MPRLHHRACLAGPSRPFADRCKRPSVKMTATTAVCLGLCRSTLAAASSVSVAVCGFIRCRPSFLWPVSSDGDRGCFPCLLLVINVYS